MLSRLGLEETKAPAAMALVGRVFGRLTVVAVGQKPRTYRYMAVCQCSCGSPIKAIRIDGLTSGAVVACGCVHKESVTTHGQTNSGHLDRWHHMMSRCYNTADAAYQNYGGRGIKVCPEWHDARLFVEGLPAGHFDGAEIDRIDNDGDYEPGNVRWSTHQENADNRRTARNVTYLGRTQSLSAWASEFGLSRVLVWQRVVTFGWDIGRALTEPAINADDRMAIARHARWGNHKKRQKPTPRVEKTVLFRGENLTIAQLSTLTGISPKLLRKRIFERGWAVERAAHQKDS